jgi:hypothetical protein
MADAYFIAPLPAGPAVRPRFSLFSCLYQLAAACATDYREHYGRKFARSSGRRSGPSGLSDNRTRLTPRETRGFPYSYPLNSARCHA